MHHVPSDDPSLMSLCLPPEAQVTQARTCTPFCLGLLVAAAGVQYLLPATYTALKSAPGGVDLVHLAQLLSTAPAQLAGLGHRKGKLAPGMDADIMVSMQARCAESCIDMQLSTRRKYKSDPYVLLWLCMLLHSSDRKPLQ